MPASYNQTTTNFTGLDAFLGGRVEAFFLEQAVMNDETHDDSSYVLDRAITFHRGWSIERETSQLWVWYHPDDQEVVSFASSPEAARMAIDAVIAAEEEERFEQDLQDGRIGAPDFTPIDDRAGGRA